MKLAQHINKIRELIERAYNSRLGKVGIGKEFIVPAENISAEYSEDRKRMEKIPVILVSRSPAGETLDIYGYEGAGKRLKKIGVIFSEYLNGQKARIKTIIALKKSKNEEELRKLFE